MSPQSITKGVHHVGLTVKDLNRTTQFFTDTLGFEKVGEVPDYPAAFVSDGNIMVALWQAENPAQAVGFDRKKNIGLHHLAICLNSYKELDDLNEQLSKVNDVTIEFAPEPLSGGPTRHMMCTEPGGIRIEFIVPAKG